MSKKIMQQALDALDSKYIVNCGAWLVQVDKAIEALRTALAKPDTTPDSATRSADSAESFCKQELHNLMSVAGRMALELECLLLDTKDLSVVSKWWDTGMESLQAYRDYIWSITHGKDEESSSTCQSCGKFLGTEWIIHICTPPEQDNDDLTAAYLSGLYDGKKAQPEQEPVAWVKDGVLGRCDLPKGFTGCLYTAPISEPVKERISEPDGNLEPDIFYRCNGCGFPYEFEPPHSCDCMNKTGFTRIEYYTAPPKREWFGLTDEDFDEIYKYCDIEGYEHLAPAIEAKLKEKNA